MSSGVPGGSGENFLYFALCGVSLTAGFAYAYRTLTDDRTRYNDRVAELQARPKDEWQPKPWPPKESEAEEAGGDEGEETAAEAAVAVDAPLEDADASEVVEAEPAVVEAEPVSVETVSELSGAAAAVGDLEAELAEAMEEAPAEVAPAPAESDVLIPDLLSAVNTVSEVEAAENVGILVSPVGETPEMLDALAGETVEAEEPKQSELEVSTGPDANQKDLTETQAVMGVVSERESVVLADDTPTASPDADKSVVVQLGPEAMEASAAEMCLVEKTAGATAIEEDLAVFTAFEELVSSSEEQAPDTTAEGSEVNVENEAVESREAKESMAAAFEDPEVSTSSADPLATSKEEPAPDSTVEGPIATADEEARDAEEAKDFTVAVEELEIFSSTEEPLSSEEEEPTPDSTTEGPVASFEKEPAEAPTESNTLQEVKTEATDASIDPPTNVPEVKTTAASLDKLTEETLPSKDESSEIAEAEISPDVEVENSLAMNIGANPITEAAAEMKDKDHPVVPAEMCPGMETSEPVLKPTALAEEEALSAAEKAQTQLTGTEAAEPKWTPTKEYIVVVLEGAPKEPKTPEVLAIAPMTAREELTVSVLEVKET